MHATALGRIKASIGWKGKEARKGERGKVERTSKRKMTRGLIRTRHIQFASSWRIGAYEEVPPSPLLDAVTSNDSPPTNSPVSLDSNNPRRICLLSPKGGHL